MSLETAVLEILKFSAGAFAKGVLSTGSKDLYNALKKSIFRTAAAENSDNNVDDSETVMNALGKLSDDELNKVLSVATNLAKSVQKDDPAGISVKDINAANVKIEKAMAEGNIVIEQIESPGDVTISDLEAGKFKQ